MAPVIRSIRTGVAFSPLAAASFIRAESALGRRIQTTSTYRDYNLQLKMYRDWQSYISGKGPYPGHSLALHPDQSKHCLGLAMDSNEWVNPRFNAFVAEYGWIRTAASDPTERHHFEYQSWRDKHLNEPAGSGVTEIEMPLDATDKEFLNGLGASIIQQIRGASGYESEPLTIRAIRNDIGYRDARLDSISSAISKLSVGDGLSEDEVNRIISAIQSQPAETVALIKSKL